MKHRPRLLTRSPITYGRECLGGRSSSFTTQARRRVSSRSKHSTITARFGQTDRLKKRSPKKYRAIIDAIRVAAPFFDDFVLEPDAVDSSVIQLEWRHKTDPSYFNAHALSDGTLRFMCLAALFLQPSRPSVIVVDEPELGLHPAAIVQLAELMRLASRDSQVIVATQSVTLLDQFASEDVIVVERSNGASTFRRLAEDQVRGWVDDYSLGDLWLENVLGGRPS